MAYFCPNCGEPVKNAARFCESCGMKLREDEPEVDYTSYTSRKSAGNVQYEQVSQAPVFNENEMQEVVPVQEADTDPYAEYQRHTYDYKGRDRQEFNSSYGRANSSSQTYERYGYEYMPDPSWPVRSKIAAGILGILLGGIGVHKFYLGQIGKGILYVLFAWTGIPAIIGLVQGILYLTQSGEEFSRKNHVRVE